MRLLATALELATIDERRLDGIHALTFVDDVALVAVPDAAHRPWGPVSAVVPVPAPPVVPQAAPNPCVDDEAFEACDRPPTIIDVSPDSGLASVATPIVIRDQGSCRGR